MYYTPRTFIHTYCTTTRYFTVFEICLCIYKLHLYHDDVKIAYTAVKLNRNELAFSGISFFSPTTFNILLKVYLCQYNVDYCSISSSKACVAVQLGY